MAKVELEITIDKEGKTHVHVKGAKGKACMEYKKLIESFLGKVVKEQKTSEYYEDEIVDAKKIKKKL